MRIVRFSPPPSTAPNAQDPREPVFAILDDARPAGEGRAPRAGSLRVLSRAPWLGGSPTGEVVPYDDRVALLAPVAPSKILCVGRNYAAHAKELGNEVPKEPLLFLKPPSALIGHEGTIVLPPESTRVEHEAELGVVIGKRCRAIAPEQARAHIFGLTCTGDITARDLQRSDGQWARAKGFDTFCPVGPWIETDLDPRDVRIACTVNGATKQDGRTAQMIFPVDVLLAYASRMMTLEPGDLVLTGTPEGVGPLVHGDRIEITVEGIGTLGCAVRK
ncbi:fumarylacetoacetate hydrolase family protein [Pendulispora albinea]|uniref:Fumarylacetoacetate hydrolase family protein n=1 Tax=Pendulispora albinea TaxID=2741071 RepID=A0ABZ2LVD7_9BACT